MSPIKPLLFLVFGLVVTYSVNAQEGYYSSLSFEEIDSLFYVEYSKGSYHTAIPYVQAAREKAKAEFGEMDTLFAMYTINLGFMYNAIGQYNKVFPLYEQAIDIQEKVLGKEHPDFASSLGNLATLYQNLGHYEKALPLFIEAKKILEVIVGKEHLDYAYSLNNLATLSKIMGNHEEALLLFMEAKDIFEKILGRENPSFAQLTYNLAAFYISMGNYEKALPLFTEALSIREKVLGKKHADYAISLNGLAALHFKMGNYEQALPLYIQAKNVAEEALGNEHPDFARAVNNLAILHKKMGNYYRALPLYIQTKHIREKVLGKEHADYAISLNNLASLYRVIGDYDLALPLLIEAKDINEKALGRAHPNFASTLNSLASFYQEVGNYEQALLLVQEALNIQEKVLGNEHPDFVEYIINLAILHKKMGNIDLSWKVFWQAVSSCTTVELAPQIDTVWFDGILEAPFPSNRHLEHMITVLKLSYELLKKDETVQGANEKLILVSDLATALLSKLRMALSNEKDKLRILTQSTDWVLKNLDVLTTEKHSLKAFNLADQNKSVLLLQATKSEAVYRLGELPDSLARKDRKLLKEQSQLEAKLIENRSEIKKDSLRNLLIEANQDINDFRDFIKENYPQYHQLKYQEANANAKEIQKKLAENTALLEYVIGDSVTHIFYIDRNKIEWHKSVLTAKKLNQYIKNMHGALSNYELVVREEEKAYNQYTECAHWFYQQLVEPVLKGKSRRGEHEEGNTDLKSMIQNLIIITDGKLGHLPFETFLVEAAPQKISDYSGLHYLVNDYNISYNYSATLWKENEAALPPKNNGEILAMAANYSMKLDSSMMNVRLPTDQLLREHLTTLPSARKEVELLQKEFKGFFAFDKLASEKVIKKMAPDYAIIHLAMHGLLNNKRPVLSSLAFTEDNDSLESNFWQAHEISKLQLNANLVVLSACETGFGKFEKGNGIASLARAFMYAGASSLIVSLWQVDDNATAEIMETLYHNLANGLKKDEALRQAKILYVKSAEGVLAHPAFWSPFIQIGNTQAVQIKRKGNLMIWGIGAGVLLLLGLMGFRMLRKNKEIEA